jgi:hypothetical protein
VLAGFRRWALRFFASRAFLSADPKTSSPLPAALNPTYTYGKRTPTPTVSDGRAAKTATPPPAGAGGGGGDTAATRTPPPRPLFDHHGHKASLLAKPLPPTADEAGAAAAK